jgi:D-alanine-D-alanine ligase
MNSKKKVAVVCGGYSGEAQISMKSAATVMQHIDRDKFEPYQVVISKSSWKVLVDNKEFDIDKNDFSFILNEQKINFDVVFNIVHGTPGEDGKLQGYLDMIGLPYTSSDVTTSAITFNKAFTTALLKSYGILSAKSMMIKDKNKIDADFILKQIQLPCFVKPNNGGSSIGTTKVTKQEELKPAIEKAFKEDGQVIVEEFVEGVEVTCGVMEIDGRAKAMAITEIVSASDFFDFEAKYADQRTQEITPARISKELYDECLKITENVYEILMCKGMVRIDYIIKNNQFYLIEVNSVPGLTERSLIPQHAEFLKLTKKDLFTFVIEQTFTK